MRKKWNICLEAVCVAGLLVCTSGVAAARGSQYGQGAQSQPPAQQSDKPKTPEVTPLTLDAPAPVNAEEDTAYVARVRRVDLRVRASWKHAKDAGSWRKRDCVGSE